MQNLKFNWIKTIYNEGPWKILVIFITIINVFIILDANFLLSVILFIIFFVFSKKIILVITDHYTKFKILQLHFFNSPIQNQLKTSILTRTLIKKKFNLYTTRSLINWDIKFPFLTWIDDNSHIVFLLLFKKYFVSPCWHTPYPTSYPHSPTYSSTISSDVEYNNKTTFLGRFNI